MLLFILIINIKVILKYMIYIKINLLILEEIVMTALKRKI